MGRVDHYTRLSGLALAAKSPSWRAVPSRLQQRYEPLALSSSNSKRSAFATTRHLLARMSGRTN